MAISSVTSLGSLLSPTLSTSGSNTPTVQLADLTALGSYYSSGASLSSSLLAKVLAQNGAVSSSNAKATVTPPWLDTSNTDTTALADKVFLEASQPLADLNDPSLDRPGITDDYKKLFALYKGLTRLKDVTDYAKSDAGAPLRIELDNAFRALTKQYFDFVNSQKFTGITLVPGIKLPSETSSLTIPDAVPLFTGSTASTDRSQPIAGLTGNELFTIHVTEGGATRDIPIDLTQVGGSKTIDDVAAYINAQFQADGSVAASVSVKRVSETDYRLQFDLVDGEDLSFSADPSTQQPAVYVTGTAGGGDFASAFLTKFDDLGNATPTTDFTKAIDTDKADSGNAVARDSQGNVYVVGSTSGDLNGQINQGSGDVYLRKYDATGQEIYTRMLGATGDAAGLAVTVDASDNVIVAGRTSAALTGSTIGSGTDSFVSKFDSSGQELFTRQTASFASDSAQGLTTDAAGNIFVTGTAAGAVDGNTALGGTDAYLTKLDASGNLVYSRQIGDAADQTAVATATDGAGNLFVLYNDNGHAKLAKYADAAGGSATFTTDLGAVGQGAATGLARDGSGAIYVTGFTDAATLNGSTANAFSGGTDAFVSKLDETSGSISYVSYIGTGSDDRANGIAVNGSDVYLTGSTAGALPGATQVGSLDGFVAKLDGSAGTLTYAQQFGSGLSYRGTGIIVDPTGTSVLSRLGLPTGAIPPASATTVSALTTARAGESFKISVNGLASQTITLAADDTFSSLAIKINQALGGNGVARFVDDIGTGSLKIAATNSASVQLIAGPAGSNLLSAIGLSPTTLYGSPPGTQLSTDLTPQTDVTDILHPDDASKSIFELGFVDNLNLKTGSNAAQAGDIIDNALLAIRKAFDFITNGPSDSSTASAGSGQASAETLKQLAAYQGLVTTGFVSAG